MTFLFFDARHKQSGLRRTTMQHATQQRTNQPTKPISCLSVSKQSQSIPNNPVLYLFDERALFLFVNKNNDDNNNNNNNNDNNNNNNNKSST
jgi:hypothetical protein